MRCSAPRSRRRPHERRALRRRYGLGAPLQCPRAPDDRRAGALLRRAGPSQERPQHHDDERHRPRARGRAVGGGGVLARLPHRRRLARRVRLGRFARRRSRARPHLRGHDPPSGTRGVPGDVRDHHPGAHFRGDRGAHAVPGVCRLSRPLGDVGLRSAGALGVGRRRVALEAWGARLRRRHGGAHQRGRVGAGGGLDAGAAQGLSPRPARSPQRADRPARRRAAVVRLVRLQRRVGAGGQRPRDARLREYQHRRRHRVGHVGAARSVPGRQDHGGRRGDRARRRARGDHAGGRLRDAARGARHRRRRRRDQLYRDPDPLGQPARRCARRVLVPRPRRRDGRPAHRRLRHQARQSRRGQWPAGRQRGAARRAAARGRRGRGLRRGRHRCDPEVPAGDHRRAGGRFGGARRAGPERAR